MIRKLATSLLFAFVLLSIGLFIFTSTSYGEKKARNYVENFLSKTLKKQVSIEKITVISPFFIKLKNIHIHDEESSIHCNTLSFVPLLIDLPFQRLTLLRLHARSLSITSSQASSSFSLPVSLSILSASLSPLHVTLPNKKPFEGSLKGRIYCSNNFETMYIKGALSRSSFDSLPKKIDVVFHKQKNMLKLESTLVLSESENFFSKQNKLDLSCSIELKDDSFSFDSIHKLDGAWSLAMPLSPFLEEKPFFRSIFAKGRFLYSEKYPLQIFFEDFGLKLCFFPSFEKKEKAFFSFNEHEPHTFLIQAHGMVECPLDGQPCTFSLPSCSLGEAVGSLLGDFSLKKEDEGFSSSCHLEGMFTKGLSRIPVAFSFHGLFGKNQDEANAELSLDPLFFMGKYEKTKESKAFHGQLVLQDLSSLNSFSPFSLEGEGKADFSYVVDDAHEEGSGSLVLSEYAFNSLHGKKGLIEGSFDSRSSKVPLHVTIEDLSLDSTHFDTVSISSTIDHEAKNLHLNHIKAKGMVGDLPFDLLGNGDGTFHQAFRVTIDRLEGMLSDYPVSLKTPISMHLLPDYLQQISGAFSISDNGFFSLRWHRSSPLCATGDLLVKDFPASFVSSSLKTPLHLGTLNGEVHYLATPTVVTGKAHGSFTLGSFVDSSRIHPPIHAGFSLSLEKDTLDSHIAFQTDTAPLQLDLALPVRRIPQTPFIQFSKTAPVSGHLDGCFSLQTLLDSFTNNDDRFDGILLPHLTLKGTLDDPLCSGELVLKHGRVDLFELGSTLSDIEMIGSIENNHMKMQHVLANDGNLGTISGDGTMSLTKEKGFQWDLDASIENLHIVNLPYASALVDALVHLHGDLDSLLIQGNATVKKGVFDLAARFPSSLPDIPVIFVDDKPEASSFHIPFRLSIDTLEGIEVKGRGLSSFWDGKVLLHGKTPNLLLDGTLSVASGSFELASKPMEITKGSLSLSGDLFTASKLHVITETSTPSITARLVVQGSLEKPKLSLDSTPSRAQNEILSLLLFNKEYSDISPIESLQLANIAMTIEHPNLFDPIGTIKKLFWIDTISVGASPINPKPPPSLASGEAPSNDVSLKVGKYLSDGVTVTLSKDVSDEANRVGLEVELEKNVSLQAEVGDDAEGIVTLKWKKDY